jgi:hypothetical protein
MKQPHISIYLFLFFCIIFGCQNNKDDADETITGVFDNQTAEDAIRDAFMSNESDSIKIVEFSLESEKTALVESILNGYHLSSRMIYGETGWTLSEIQNTEGDWAPAEQFLKIEGTIRYPDRPYVNEIVTLYEVIEEEGAQKIRFRIGDEGKLLNPYTKTDSQGDFSIISDRRFWEESGKFTLGVAVMGQEVYLRTSDDATIVVSVDEDAKYVDIGEITIRF